MATRRSIPVWIPLLLACAMLGGRALAQEGCQPCAEEAALARLASEQTSGATVPATINAGPIENIAVDAERIETTVNAEGQRLVTASGNVRAVVTQPATQPSGKGLPTTATILADTVTVNVAAREALAQGRVTLISGDRVARGERLVYRWEQQEGRVEQVTFRQYGLAFRADALEMSNQRLVVTGAAFSTCGLDHPDYLITARKITIVPNRNIVARDASVELFGRRLIRVPRLEYRLRRGRAGAHHALPVARPGHTEVSGYTLAQPLPLKGNLDGEVEATTRIGVRGVLNWENAGRVTPYAEATWKQEEGVRGRTPVLVSRLPQVGLRFGPQNALDANVGFYREHSTHTDAGRLEVRANRTLLDRGERPGLTLRVGARGAWYTGGEFYRVLSMEAALGRGGADIFEEAGVRLNAREGRTPFLWDAVQVPTELFATRRIAWGHYRLEGGIRYDLERREVYDVQVAVGKRFHCLEPEVRYSTRSEGVFLNLRVFGLDSTAPAGPAPVATPTVEAPSPAPPVTAPAGR